MYIFKWFFSALGAAVVAATGALPASAAVHGAIGAPSGDHTRIAIGMPLGSTRPQASSERRAPLRLAQIVIGGGGYGRGGRGFGRGGFGRGGFGRGRGYGRPFPGRRWRDRGRFDRGGRVLDRIIREERRRRFRDRRYRDNERAWRRDRNRRRSEERRWRNRAKERRDAARAAARERARAAARERARTRARRVERAKDRARAAAAERRAAMLRARARAREARRRIARLRHHKKIRERLSKRQRLRERLRRHRLAWINRWRRRCGHRPVGSGNGRPGSAVTAGYGPSSVGKRPDRPGGWRRLPCGPRIVVIPPILPPIGTAPDPEPPERPVGPTPPKRVVDGTPPVPPRPPRASSPGPRAAPPAPPAQPAVTADTRFWPGQIVAQIDRFAPATIDDAIAQDYNLQRLSSETNGLVGRRIVLYRVPDQRDVAAVSQALAADPRVTRAQLNWRYQLNQDKREPSRQVSQASLQYTIAKIRLAGALAVSQGSGVKIAIIDSGIDEKHKALESSVEKRFDATKGEGKPDDVHGTAIAGIIRARGTAQGIAPEARILAVRAFFKIAGFDGPQSSTVVLLRALDWAVASGARVVNMSFAGPKDADIAEAIAAAARKGVALVAAAGNGGPKAKPAYPAAYAEVIAVTATDEYDQLYARANRGAYITLAAPGVDVFVLAPGNSHTFQSGTSMAAAHVSGLIALILERNDTLAADEIRSAFVRTAHDLGATGIDTQFGAGRVDAEALLKFVPPKSGPAVSLAKTGE